MEYSFSASTKFCPEPPLLSAVRGSFASVLILLSAVFGTFSLAVVSVSFKFKWKFACFAEFLKSDLLIYLVLFAVIILSYISLAVIQRASQNVYVPLSSDRFTAAQIFLPLSAAAWVGVCLTAFCGFRFSSFPTGTEGALALFGILSAVVVFASVTSIKSTVRNNIPRSCASAVGVFLIPLIQAAFSFFVVAVLFAPDLASKHFDSAPVFPKGRFPYAEYSVLAAAAVFMFASAVLSAVVFASYFKNVSDVKKKYGKVK